MEDAREEKKVWGCDSLQVWLGLGGRELRWVAARDLDSAAGSSFPPWPSAETIRAQFAVSSGGTKSMPKRPCGQSAACERLSEVGRVNRGQSQKQWWRKTQRRENRFSSTEEKEIKDERMKGYDDELCGRQ